MEYSEVEILRKGIESPYFPVYLIDKVKEKIAQWEKENVTVDNYRELISELRALNDPAMEQTINDLKVLTELKFGRVDSEPLQKLEEGGGVSVNEKVEYFKSGQTFKDVNSAIDNMRKHVNEWSVRDTLKKFTEWGFYKGSIMASIDESTARDICRQLKEYVNDIKYNQRNLDEVYDVVNHYVRMNYKEGGEIQGRLVTEISTHKAVVEGDKINIYIKGMPKEDANEEDLRDYPHWFKDELINTIPLENEDDVFAIFETLQEDNRINVTEANEEFKLKIGDKVYVTEDSSKKGSKGEIISISKDGAYEVAIGIAGKEYGGTKTYFEGKDLRKI